MDSILNGFRRKLHQFQFIFSNQSILIKRNSVNWITRHVSDQYVKKAVHEDLRARSAYKLIQIQEKYKFISPKDFVIDLGAAPGGLVLF
jgi:predicted rRNA methylase YqxC with S4 and FtsJ domains